MQSKHAYTLSVIRQQKLVSRYQGHYPQMKCIYGLRFAPGLVNTTSAGAETGWVHACTSFASER